MHILVCGGAGYIGSHMVKMLHGAGHAVTVFDNLSTGNAFALKWGNRIHGDLRHPSDLDALFAAGPFDAVMHFCARSIVPESIADPAGYYQNNVAGTLNLLDAMIRNGVRRFIFSSSAAVYGHPSHDPITETHPLVPITPYGRTKAMVEAILQDYAPACGMRSVSLRYFNAAGADPAGEIGEAHHPETHLIPSVLKSVLGKGAPLKVFGADYPTPDGTCIRDYVHVNDLCAAHLKALDFLEAHPGAHAFNLGNGKGFSILEVIRAAESVTGRPIPYTIQARRPGDPARLVADSGKASAELGWRPAFTDIEAIIETAWWWEGKIQDARFNIES